MEMDIAEKLRTLMTAKKLSQYRLAEISHVPQPTIRRILIGESKEPRRSTVAKLATALEVSSYELLSAPDGDFREEINEIFEIGSSDLIKLFKSQIHGFLLQARESKLSQLGIEVENVSNSKSAAYKNPL